ncbi:hypothetical protein LU674_013130 [Pseudomonas alloputida]|uniref:DUF6651 domain-containing protein n=2 Tax=Gammaproteobacteria TaxID=1236 RepID=A0AAW7HVQ2_9PSED|nr:DUF6651 domain-containing protein [Pseudomonas alloputida]MCE0860692.1 hypothetical protein [Pseudomonas alloputida]MCE0866716.1 hypothetical protein [Pseudomonas alloputida]MCE0889850.1 hypothetical protein [Pseudomonas alloputida]MCE0919061.1 hypothetical protein [Pseudomonas alloputida]MCE1045576.1 hypothetical protein [Pseudomonas alloputida]
MKIKTVEVDGKQYAEIQDGKPVYIEDDGKEVAFDAVGTRNTITRLNAEAKSHRERAENAEKIAKAFEGIEDAGAARKALETVANLDAKKLVDAGEIEKVKGEISKAFQTQLDEANGKAATFEQQLYAEMIGGNFARSKFIADKLAVPADMVQATFGRNLKIEDGKVVAYDAQGQKIFSRARPGELADFDEALETLVSQYPHRDHILKSSDANGGGAQNGGGGNSGAKGNFGGSKADRVAAIKAMTANT